MKASMAVCFAHFLKTNRPPSYSRSTVDKLIIALGATEQLGNCVESGEKGLPRMCFVKQ